MSSPVGKERPEIDRLQVQQSESSDFLPAMASEKVDEAMGSRDIGTNRMRGSATIMGQISCPTRRKRTRGMFDIV